MESLRIMSIFWLGTGANLIGETASEQDTKSDAILEKFGLSKELKILVRKEEELLEINIYGVNGYAIFPYGTERFSPLIYLAEVGKPIMSQASWEEKLA